MDILVYLPNPARLNAFVAQLSDRLPQARVRAWVAGDQASANYVLAWKPPREVLAGRDGLKAIIYLAAGVEYLVDLLRGHPDLIKPDVALLRMEDAGMGRQLVEYAEYCVLHYFRHMHDYQADRVNRRWQKREPEVCDQFTIGIMGLGTLGEQVALALSARGFPVRGWSRSQKRITGVTCHAGDPQRSRFLTGLRLLINLLPLTPETENILDARCFQLMKAPAYVVNIGRGRHLVDSDLLAAIATGQVGGATLDVFRQEPLPEDHPFWVEPRIAMTPHMAAVTLSDEGVEQVVEMLVALQAGKPVRGTIDLARGY